MWDFMPLWFYLDEETVAYFEASFLNFQESTSLLDKLEKLDKKWESLKQRSQFIT